MVYQVKIESFEGPLDLLMQLIEEQKLDITQVSLAKVALDFLKHIQNKSVASLKNLSDFLDIASKLILAKSKVLIPQLELTAEEQEDLEDLENRLKEYQVFKHLTKELKELADSDARGFSRSTKVAPHITVFDPPNVSHGALYKIFQEVLDKMPKEEVLPKAVVKETVSIKDKIVEIKLLFNSSPEIKFSEFLSKAKTNIEIIVSFLAILELLKLRHLEAKQDSNFSEIILMKKETG